MTAFKTEMFLKSFSDSLIDNTQDYLDNLEAAEETRIKNQELAQQFEDNMIPNLGRVARAFEKLNDIKKKERDATQDVIDAQQAYADQQQAVVNAQNKVAKAQEKVNSLKDDGTEIDAGSFTAKAFNGKTRRFS